MKAKLWLQDKAIELLSQNCTSIGIVYPKNFKRTISSKLDDLIFVIPVFAKLFKTVGGLLKENIEQIQNIFNIILLNLLCMREKVAQVTIAMERMEVRNKTTGQIGKQKRKFCCKNCKVGKEIVVLINGICPQCGFIS